MKRWLVLALAVLLVAGLALAVPPALRTANTSALAALARGDAGSAVRTFRVLAFIGHADALNNLGVIRLRGADGNRDTEAGLSLLDRAHAKGHAVAGYNLARMAESKFDTPMDEVARTLALLQPLVDAGDPHAAAEMADALGYRNRVALVPNLLERRLELRRAAAAGGDPTYLYRLARDLWDHARELENPGLAIEAIDVMQRAAAGGERRAMLHMGDMEWQMPPGLEALLTEGFPGGDRYDWWARGAEAGSIAAACRYATNFFNDTTRLDAVPPVHEGPRPPLDRRTATALRHVDTCAEADRVRGPFNPAFGAPALYLSRPLGGYERVETSRSYARMIRGILRLEGRLADRDPEGGRADLEAAARNNDRARAVLATVPR